METVTQRTQYESHNIPFCSATSLSMKERFLPYLGEFPIVEPSGVHVFFKGSIAERVAGIKAITPESFSFATRVNRELERISAYYEAVGLWANVEHRTALLAERLNVPKEQYRALLAESGMNSLVAFGRLLTQAEASGLSPDDIAKVVSQARSIDPKPTARQRMLMMKTVMNSTPVIVADLLSSRNLGNYGFADGQKAQIFAGKAKVGGMSFSATASPRLFKEEGVRNSGYVFRFCVGKCAFAEFEEDHPVYMLDNKVVETITAWHQHSLPDVPLENNPLLVSMTKLLLVPTHDWGHSWLLYDTNAKTQAFKNWGNDIYAVEHLDKNKLLINYEILTASMHKYTWQVLFNSNPRLKPTIMDELSRYHEAVLSFASFVQQQWGDERAHKEENYLMYIPLSTLPCVLDWRMPELGSLLSQYPIVRDQVTQILGNFFDILSSNHDGVPSKSLDGQLISTAEYIRGYPLREEMASRLRQERLESLVNSATGGISVEAFRAFRDLPACISNQFPESIADPSILPTLAFSLTKLKTALQGEGMDSSQIERVYERVHIAPSGHLFVRLERNEIDYDKFSLCKQDKRALLVEVPEGMEIAIRTRTRASLVSQVTKQHTVATGDDMVAFNVQNSSHAEEILRAGAELSGEQRIQALIAKANELASVQSATGADDIYPIRKTVAARLYGSAETGYRELLGRTRFACASCGPIELPLHDGSVQKTLSGVLVYIPGTEPELSGNNDPDPDLHGIEAGAFDRTYSASASSITPFYLRSNSALVQGADAARVSLALHRFVKDLEEINLQIDLGASSGALGKGLF
jgi:hypothetical protein